MQAVLEGTRKLIENEKEIVCSLLSRAENSDHTLRNRIENELVQMGEQAIHILVNSLKTASNSTRALIAMSLIRIGIPCIEPLRSAYSNDEEFTWVVNYIINEIEGTKKPLQKMLECA